MVTIVVVAGIVFFIVFRSESTTDQQTSLDLKNQGRNTATESSELQLDKKEQVAVHDLALESNEAVFQVEKTEPESIKLLPLSTHALIGKFSIKNPTSSTVPISAIYFAFTAEFEDVSVYSYLFPTGESPKFLKSSADRTYPSYSYSFYADNDDFIMVPAGGDLRVQIFGNLASSQNIIPSAVTLVSIKSPERDKNGEYFRNKDVFAKKTEGQTIIIASSSPQSIVNESVGQFRPYSTAEQYTYLLPGDKDKSIANIFFTAPDGHDLSIEKLDFKFVLLRKVGSIPLTFSGHIGLVFEDLSIWDGDLLLGRALPSSTGNIIFDNLAWNINRGITKNLDLRVSIRPNARQGDGATFSLSREGVITGGFYPIVGHVGQYIYNFIVQ